MPPLHRLRLPLWLLSLGLLHLTFTLTAASSPSGGTVEGRVLQDLSALALATPEPNLVQAA